VIAALFFVPAIAGLLAFLVRHDSVRRALLVVTALVHLTLVGLAWWRTPEPSPNGWFALDPLGLLFLSITSLLFAVAAPYAVGYLAREARAPRADLEEGTLFVNGPEAVLTGCLMLFLATMTLVTVSQHLGMLWVAVEATTLASAPLIFFHRHHRSLEATWKYLLICSVGIAVALLGNFFLAMAATAGGADSGSMVVSELLAGAASFHTRWLKAAFILMLVGYGTKMGLAPLHTWLPDAHAESPSVVSALLSGALLNCAFLAVLRGYQVLVPAGLGEFGGSLLVLLGLVSMGIAAAFIVGQTDFKRMLAYSSVEHVGILALGVGLGGAGVFGALLHAVNHSLTKGMLFLLAGNILAAYKSKSTSAVRAVARRLPITGALWIVGLLAITGSPPFGPFLSELVILKAALDGGRTAVAVAYLVALTVVFVGMGRIMLTMAQGEDLDGAGSAGPETALSVASPAILAAMVLGLGLFVPPALTALLRAAALVLGGA
jgi:hydrogenase-4 component F